MCHRYPHTLRSLTAAASILVALLVWITPSMAEQYEYSPKFEYKEYIVKKGDTLWAISKSELEDAFQWPMVWRENLKINNPDLISPGQVIIIPIRVIEARPIEPEAVVEAEPEEAMAEEPVAPIANEPEPEVAEIESRGIEPLVGRDLLIASGYITRVIPDAGVVEGDPFGRSTFAEHDMVYIKTRKRARVGDKFYVIKKYNLLKHPHTKKRLGWLVRVAGVVETEEAGRNGLKARVISSYEDIQTGDSLDYHYDISAPFLVGEPRRPQTSGYVVASNYMRIINAAHDIVFIDKGTDQGMRLGDVIMTLVEGTDDMMSSVVQLVNVRNETSLGIILKSTSEVQMGDTFQGIR